MDEQVGSSSFSSVIALDMGYSLLSNMIESFASQEGHLGSVSTILNKREFRDITMRTVVSAVGQYKFSRFGVANNCSAVYSVDGLRSRSIKLSVAVRKVSTDYL